MTTSEGLIFGVMVFIAIVLLATAMIVPTAGTAAQANRKMRQRMRQHLQLHDPGTATLIREQYLGNLSPFERGIEKLPFLQSLSRLVEQSGETTSVAKVLFKSLVFALVVAIPVFFYSRSVLLGLLAGLAVAFVPVVLLLRKRAQRIVVFEEQLADSLGVMARALKAGHPLSETFNLISEEMQDPIASEFGRVFSDLNFGMPLKAALQSLLVRIPSMSLHSFVTAVLIQNESGGGLAEILENVAEVIRSRFKLQRKIKTVSAEGRMSAWVLAMVPFVLAIMLSLANPDYLPVLLNDPLGQKIILAAFGMMCIGILWIRRIIRIEV